MLFRPDMTLRSWLGVKHQVSLSICCVHQTNKKVIIDLLSIAVVAMFPWECCLWTYCCCWHVPVSVRVSCVWCSADEQEGDQRPCSATYFHVPVKVLCVMFSWPTRKRSTTCSALLRCCVCGVQLTSKEAINDLFSIKVLCVWCPADEQGGH